MGDIRWVLHLLLRWWQAWLLLPVLPLELGRRREYKFAWPMARRCGVISQLIKRLETFDDTLIAKRLNLAHTILSFLILVQFWQISTKPFSKQTSMEHPFLSN